MFKIYDGRDAFYQWDLEQKLIVEDPSINEVHFCNRTDECSLVCEVYDEEGQRLVNVPNILLQTDWNINVYAYCENYTKHSEVFRVHKRSRPADYMYTETEVKTWDELEQRVINLEENGVPTETLNAAIENYFVENPIKETDLTGYATEDYVDAAINGIPKVDLSDYYTKKETDDAISDLEIQINNNEADILALDNAMDDFALKSEIPDVSGFAKTEDIPDVSAFALKSDIPDVSGYQTEEQVLALIQSNMPASGDEVSY